jgi:hypothetical protein
MIVRFVMPTRETAKMSKELYFATGSGGLFCQP